MYKRGSINDLNRQGTTSHQPARCSPKLLTFFGVINTSCPRYDGPLELTAVKPFAQKLLKRLLLKQFQVQCREFISNMNGVYYYNKRFECKKTSCYKLLKLQ